MRVSTRATAPTASALDGPDLPVFVPAQETFVGRERELDRLDRVFELVRLGPVPQAVVVHGTAGVGKTALAAEWATRKARDHAPVWWVKADSPASIVSGLSELTRVLRPVVPEFFEGEGRWEWALQWLSSHDGWVLVLDDVRNPGNVRVLLSRIGTGGQVLLTSRLALGWDGIAVPTELDVPELDEVVDMFTRYAGREVEGAEALCADLRRLPVAVTRAGELVGESWWPVHEYRTAAAEYVMGEAPHASESEASPVRGVSPLRGTLWQVLRAADDAVPEELLLTLAWFGAPPVPRTVVSGIDTPSAVARALEFLTEHELVRTHDDTVLLHPVLARVADPNDPHRGREVIDTARRRALTCLAGALPDDPDDPEAWPSWWQLVPHVEALAERLPARDDTDAFAHMLTAYARFLLGQGQPGRGTVALERADRPYAHARHGRVPDAGYGGTARGRAPRGG
ncbi:AAA family ATPase [Streptomyces sp. NPDC020607]|uniref:AAA family ATPase n=1 Tax=Streptomyces sp. NPDC020607 TaxID=3365082 RepID=UPI0037B0D303